MEASLGAILSPLDLGITRCDPDAVRSCAWEARPSASLYAAAWVEKQAAVFVPRRASRRTEAT